VSVRKFDFDKWWNTTHNGSSPTDMVARSEYKQCPECGSENVYQSVADNKSYCRLCESDW